MFRTNSQQYSESIYAEEPLIPLSEEDNIQFNHRQK
jgi:hypothetical protein